MNQKNIILTITFLFMSVSTWAEDLILCSPKATAPVMNRSLEQVLFKAQQYETVVPFQGFSQKEIKASSSTSYIRVEFTDREDEDADNNDGWIDKSYVKPKSQCKGYKEPEISQDAKASVINTSVKGLAQNCCLFPMKKKPTESFNEGMRRFGASRNRGARAHAAADLYQSQYQPIYAIADGTILRDRVPFYLGTNVTEVKHTGGFIARYGEIASSSIKPLKLGKTIKAGQLIGYIKKVNSRSVKSAMLHFELYSGKGSGPLTTKKGPYQRRFDLINPTLYLNQWGKNLL